MSRLFGSARRLLLSPPLTEVSFANRGFQVPPSASAERLEQVPQAVICGFEWAIGSDVEETDHRLSLLDPALRSFGFEGATMAFAVRDAFGGHHTRDFLRGPGQQHIFVSIVGIGLAMARMPRRLWRGIMPDLEGIPSFPAISWLAVDGYGFEGAYFHTRRWVTEQRVPAPYPWDGAPGYFPRAVDQGIGRALWFIYGGRCEAVASAIHEFAEAREPDLWSGVGLAATYAGCFDAAELPAMAEASEPYRAHLGLGAVMAAMARDYAGFVPDFTHPAVETLAGVTVKEAVSIVAESIAVATADDSEPVYEQWRRGIREALDPAESRKR